MSNNDEMRWKQRFENLQAAMAQLDAACELTHYSDLELAGLVQVFEFTFELAWKTFKDRLFYKGYEANSPREAIRLAFHQEYIQDVTPWLEALESRNRFTHTYNKAIAIEAQLLIKTRYYPMITDAINQLKKDL